jgi:transposase-like protein
MPRLTKEDKIKLINLYKAGFGTRVISKRMKIQHERTREILRQYDLFGDLALNVSSKNRKHTIEYKIELINRVNSGESIASVAIENMISSGQLCNWVKKYKELGYNGLSKPKGRPKIMKQETNKPKQIHEDEKDKKIRELEERNAQLEMEVDLLKKLRALVQQRTQQQNKKK